MRATHRSTPSLLTTILALLTTSIATMLATMLATPAADAAAGPEALVSLFPYEAEITAEGPGMVRLELPPEVLERCRSDLSDLRVFDATGRETPFVVLGRRMAEPGARLIRRVTPEVVSVERSQELPERGPTRWLETYLIEVPELPAGAGSWELELLTSRAELVARIDLWTLDEDGSQRPLLEEGSAFRLDSPRAERLRFPIAIGSGRLGIDLISEQGSYLAPTLRLEAVRELVGPAPSRVGLEILAQEHRDSETELVLDRPRGLVPAGLRVRSTTSAFHRQVTVWDEGPNADPDPLGRATLVHLDAVVPVSVDELQLRPAHGDRLRVVIENLDSPPLAEVTVEAVVTRPVLLFSLPEPAHTATLRFGGARARRPRYDLAAAAPQLGAAWSEDDASRMRAFLEPERSGTATLGAIRSNPGFDPAPALAYAMHPGAELDTRPYSHQRLLEVAPSAEGLARLRLTPEDLAIIRPDLADLRVVDPESRQWAYLLEPGAATATVALDLAGQRSVNRHTTYHLQSAVGPITATRLELELAAPFFDRAFELKTRATGHDVRQLDRGRLIRHQGDPRPQVLRLPAERFEELELIVEDGDDAPLELTRAEASIPVADLFMAAPAGAYTLLLGFPDAEAPRYELERVRPTVLAAAPGRIASHPLEESPAFSASARLGSSTGMQQILLWLAIGIAVLVLVVLTLRLARQEPGAAG